MLNNSMNLSDKTILVVDDTEFNRAIVKKNYDGLCNVVEAVNGKQGIEKLESNIVDIILVDLAMSEMNGYDFISYVKSKDEFKSIPIIVTSADGDKSERKALELGADDFIFQPYDPCILKLRIGNLLEKHDLQTEKKALQQANRFRNIFNVLELAYWEWTPKDGFYHSKEYKKYAISQMEPEKIWDEVSAYEYVHPDDVSLMKSFMTKHPDDEIKKSAMVRCKMMDGSYRWTEMFSISETSETGELERLVSIMRDVDDKWIEKKQELEEALKHADAANKAKTDFLSRVSHDMRTPLNGILGLTTLLKAKTVDDEISNELTDLELSGKYLLNLINDTLDISRIESGKILINPTVCDGRNLFNNSLGLAKISAKEKGIDLNMKIGDMPFTILYVDYNRIQQVIMNVIGNAIKFTPEGGTIDITMENLSMEKGVIIDKLTVKDSGIGMSKEFLPHIFEPFEQEDNGTTTASTGTGLGMAISKNIIESMGGDISVESKLGKGTKFTIILKLPIASDEQIDIWRKTRRNIATDEGLIGKRVLLCEDHPLNAKIAINLLEAKDMIVEHAINGETAVNMFSDSQESYYDAILMDIRMPIMDGIEATRNIRGLSREDAATVPIIAMTANAFDDDVQKTKQAGMNAHLSKPIQTIELYDTLEKYLVADEDKKKAKVLVVDDAEINRDAIKYSLSTEYEILEASNGQEALDILENIHGIIAVITDVQMPVMNGLELIKHIRSNDNFKHIVIIANTQFGNPEQEEELLALGANDFVYKPTTPKIVEIRVKNALRSI